jgi:hypothetical protein
MSSKVSSFTIAKFGECERAIKGANSEISSVRLGDPKSLTQKTRVDELGR